MPPTLAKVSRELLAEYLRAQPCNWQIDATPMFCERVGSNVAEADEIIVALDWEWHDGEYTFVVSPSTTLVPGTDPESAHEISSAAELEDFLGHGAHAIQIAPGPDWVRRGEVVTLRLNDYHDGYEDYGTEDFAEYADRGPPPHLIKSLAIENFKGIGERVGIELRPITMLFGANSAGKSTILHALHYAREIFERHNLNPDRTVAGGDFVDLGGFASFAHGHNLLPPVVLAFELDLRDRQLPVYYTPGGEMTLSAYNVEDLMDAVTSATVEVHVKGNVWNASKPAQAVRYAVAINGHPLAVLSAPVGNPGVELTEINYRHPVFTATDVFDGLAHAAEAGGLSLDLSRWVVDQQDDALPRWGQALTLSILAEPETVGRATPEMAQSAIGFMDAFMALFSRLMVGPGELLRDALCEMRYLGPLRELPGRNHQPPRYPDPSRWASGLGAWDRIVTEKLLRDACSNWLSGASLLDTGYSIELREFAELTPDQREFLEVFISEHADREASDVLDSFGAVLDNLTSGRRLIIKDENSFLEFEPPDLGVGITQLVPVTVAGIDGIPALTLIEQPELHLHPALQVRLAELFIERAHRRHGPVILETHSEHLILRLLRRIRETHEGNLPPDHSGLTPDLVAVIYVEKEKGEVRVNQLRIDETGEFRDRWPKGFFEERAEELF